MADLQHALRLWAADHAAKQTNGFVASGEISKVQMVFDEGWAGTDVTPGDPPEFMVCYTVTKKVTVRIEGEGLTKFISELVERS